MGWKKKEKALSPEEAIAAAKRELAPHWFNSEPLLAALKTAAGASVLPLNSNFVQQPWLYAFIDPTEFAGERALQIVREWHRRYSAHKIGFIIVFRAASPFVKSAPDLLRKFQIQFSAMYDQDGIVANAFGIQSWPAVVVQNGVDEILRGSGAQWLEQTEEKLQVFLRKQDRGLSLSLPYEIENKTIGQTRTDFGTQRGKSLASLSSIIQFEGGWKESEDCVTTNDPTAKAIVQCPSSVFSVIAQAGIESQMTKILVESLDGPLLQDWAPEPTVIDESGHAVARIQLFGLYYLLTGLPQGRRRFRLSFPDADTVPLSIYGLRFGSKS